MKLLNKLSRCCAFEMRKGGSCDDDDKGFYGDAKRCKNVLPLRLLIFGLASISKRIILKI
jgi:hypothetical protein